MAEMMAGRRPDAEPSERTVLLATKLQVPRSRPGLVARPRLADQLDEALGRGLVLVTALRVTASQFSCRNGLEAWLSP